MTPSRSLRIHSALALLGLLTMGCPGPSGTDAGMTGNDAGARPDTNTGATDTGMSMTDTGMTTGSIAAARRAADRANCVCQALPDYATADICASASFGAPQGDPCYDMAAAMVGGTVQTWLNCRRDADAAFATCLSAAGACDASDPCFNALDDAMTACGMEPDFTAFDAALDTCFATRVIGTGESMCSDTAPATSMLGMGVFTGTTVGQGNTRETMCAGANSGADVTYRWIAPAAGTYQFDTAGSEFDTILVVSTGCTSAAMELGCSDDGIGDSVLSQTTVTLTAGQSVQVTVDGYGPEDAGRYSVNISTAM